MTAMLSNIRVLDLSRVLAAPFAAQILGDFGAEVIKVERPGSGDDSRSFGPPFLKDADGQDTRESSFYISVNRNKKSISCDIASPEGQEIIRSLARNCDVLIENYKVGNLKRYGLDYASLSEINPDLIYCSVTGFGQTGPYAPRPGYDTIFQAMGGLMSVTGLPDDVPGGGPMKTGPSLSDILAGQFAVSAILAALYARDVNKAGGQHIDLSLLDAMIAANSHYASQYLIADSVPIRRGTEGNGGMPSRKFQCADGDIVLVAGNDKQYRALCGVLGHPELADDPRFVTNVDRVNNRKILAEVFEPLFAKRQMDALLSALEEAAVPAGPIYTMDKVFADPQVQERQMCLEIDHALAPSGKIKIVANPVKFSATPVSTYTAPPVQGEHTDEILRGLLSFSEEDVAKLRAKGVI